MSSVKYFPRHKLLMYNDTQKHNPWKHVRHTDTYVYTCHNECNNVVLYTRGTYMLPTLLHTSFLYTVIQEWKMDTFIFKACVHTATHSHTQPHTCAHIYTHRVCMHKRAHVNNTHPYSHS